jgi:hypothetical protein
MAKIIYRKKGDPHFKKEYKPRSVFFRDLLIVSVLANIGQLIYTILH